MSQSIQYDSDTGNIIATVIFNGDPPEISPQIIFVDPVITEGKKIDLATMELVDLPPYEDSYEWPDDE